MKLVESKRIYDGRVINLRVDTLETNGRTHAVEVIEHRGAVVVIAQPTPDSVVLVQQYRHPTASMLWELPAGGIDDGETPHDAAVRELREETGHRATDMRALLAAYSAPGFCDELLHFFVCSAWTEGATDFDEGEDITMKAVPLDAAWSMIERGEIRDAKTTIGILWALRELGR